MGIRPRLRLLRKPTLDAIPRLKVDDRAVQAVVGLPLVAKPSDIDRVREDPVDVASGDQAAARRSTLPATRTGKRTFSASRTVFSRTTLPSLR
jgi:hypothetical protein